MNRGTIALAMVLAVSLPGPSPWAQRIEPDSIQNDPTPQEPVAPVAVTPMAVGTSVAQPAESARISGRPVAGQSAQAATPVVAEAEPGDRFVMQAGTLLRASSGMAGMAQDKSATPAIQDLARQIAQQDSDLLTGMAALSPQAAPGASASSYTSQLQSLSQVPSGDLFDDQYTGLQAGLMQQIVAAFEAELKAADSPVKEFAAQALPGLQQLAAQSQALKKPVAAPTP